MKNDGRVSLNIYYNNSTFKPKHVVTNFVSSLEITQ